MLGTSNGEISKSLTDSRISKLPERTLRIHPGKCTGCRSCELVCSCHFVKSFRPSISSVKVEFDYRNGKASINMDQTCDLCAGLPQAACARYCFPGAIVEEEMSQTGNLT